MLTPACSATEADRLKPSIRSLSETANWFAALLILFNTSPVVNPALEKLLTAAVNPATASAALIPDRRERIRASFSLFVTSVALRPCLDSSKAASATVSKVCSVFLAISNIWLFKASNPEVDVFKMELILARLFSTSIVVVTKDLKD